jgi:hypothetical protein
MLHGLFLLILLERHLVLFSFRTVSVQSKDTKS